MRFTILQSFRYKKYWNCSKIWQFEIIFVIFFQVSDILFSGESFHTIEEINGNEENNGNQYTVPQALSQAKSEEPKFILFVSGKEINFFCNFFCHSRNFKIFEMLIYCFWIFATNFWIFQFLSSGISIYPNFGILEFWHFSLF